MSSKNFSHLLSRIKILSDRWMDLSGHLLGLGEEGIESPIDSKRCLNDPRLICKSSSPSFIRLLPGTKNNAALNCVSRKRRATKGCVMQSIAGICRATGK